MAADRGVRAGDRRSLPSRDRRANAKDVGRSVLDTLRKSTGLPSETEAEPEPSRAGRLIKWVVIGVALLWFVLPPLLDAFD